MSKFYEKVAGLAMAGVIAHGYQALAPDDPNNPPGPKHRVTMGELVVAILDPFAANVLKPKQESVTPVVEKAPPPQEEESKLVPSLSHLLAPAAIEPKVYYEATTVPDEIQRQPTEDVSTLKALYQKLVDKVEHLEQKKDEPKTEVGPIQKIAYDAQVPTCVLYSVVEVESGWHPWAVGTSTPHIFGSPNDMLEFAQDQRTKGSPVIDLGFAQINYAYHGQNFGYDLARMTNPTQNLQYAAHFLQQLSLNFTRWSDVAGAYHGASDPGETARYIKLFKNALRRCNDASIAQAGRIYSESIKSLSPPFVTEGH